MGNYIKHEFEDGQVLTHDALNEMDNQIFLNEINIEKQKILFDSRTITPAHPKSQGVANAIKRARQFTDVLWTPKGNIPGVDYGPVEGRVKYWFKPGITYRGVPYEGGVISTYTYSGLNTHLDTFLGAVANPNSILYNYDSNNDKGGAYYGTVCSKLVQHALAIPATHNTASIPKLECVDLIAEADNYTVNDVQLGDILCYTSSHTSMVTGIYYNAFHNRKSGGELLYIEVSDAVYPVCRRRLYDPDSFYKTWIKNYKLLRYKYIDNVPYEEYDYVKVEGDTGVIKYDNYALMPYYGNKCNFKKSSGTEKVHILKKGYNKAVVKRDNVIVDEISITDDTGYFTFSKSETGHIEMYLEDANGNKSESVFCYVVDSSIEVIDSSKYDKGEIKVKYSGSSGIPYYVQFGTDQTQNLRLDGLGPSIIHDDNTATLKFKVSGSSKNIRIAYNNEYGTYYSSTISFTPAEVGEAENTSSNIYLSQGKYIKDYTVTMESSSPVASLSDWAYTKVPIESNTTYSYDTAKVVWFFNGDVTLDCVDLSIQENKQFTTPDLTTSISISNINELTRVESVNAITDMLMDDTGARLEQGINLSSASYTSVENTSYFTYFDIPIEPGEMYYTRGGTRSWFLNESKTSISTENIGKNTPAYTFTAPASARYVSIAYPNSYKSPIYFRKIDKTLLSDYCD